jgi:hypothetical protein
VYPEGEDAFGITNGDGLSAAPAAIFRMLLMPPIRTSVSFSQGPSSEWVMRTWIDAEVFHAGG